MYKNWINSLFVCRSNPSDILEGIDPLQDLSPTFVFDWNPIWNLPPKSGAPKTDTPKSDKDEELYETALAFFEDKDFANAEATFKKLIESYPHSRFAIAALHELFALEHFQNRNFAMLHNYYASIRDSHLQHHRTIGKKFAARHT